MIKNQRVTQINGIRIKIINGKNGLNIFFALAINISVENDRGLAHVRGLTRGNTKVKKGGINIGGLISVGLTANDEGMNTGTIRAKCDTLDVMTSRVMLKVDCKFINTKDEEIRREREDNLASHHAWGGSSDLVHH